MGRARKALAKAAKATSEGLTAAKQASADRKFARSPQGRARAAAERGDSIFEFRAEVGSRGNGEDLSAIEQEGWTLEDTQFLHEEHTDREPDGSERSDTITYALYRFRR